MRKIYQSVPDVPQSAANKAIDIIERHFTVNGVRRAEDLQEESKVHMLRELEKFFETDLPPRVCGKDGELVYDWGSRRGGVVDAIVRWLQRVLHWGEVETPQ